MRPLILLDVDGPLSPWAAPRHAKPAGYVEHPLRLSRWSRKRLRIWLNPAHGPALLALAGSADAGPSRPTPESFTPPYGI